MTPHPTLALICLLLSLAISADQTQIPNIREARQLHWNQLYPNGGWTLYYGERLEEREVFNAVDEELGIYKMKAKGIFELVKNQREY